MQLLQIPLLPGIATYVLPQNVIAPLDAFIRTYQTGQAQNFTPVFTTTIGTLSVIVTQPEHGLTAGEMVWYPAPIAASGIIIQGPYIVTSVVDFNNYEITVSLGTDGTGSVALPIFTSVAGSSSMAVHLPAHGLHNGMQFFVNIPTTVGDVQLSGGLTVIGTPDGDHFVIQAPGTAGVSEVVTMNGGLAQAQTQIYNVDPIDFILYPISRTDYASQADKDLEFRPSTVWYDRTNPPQLVFWNRPDNQVYVLNQWAMVAPDDIVIEGGVGVDLVQRFYEAFASGLAAKLARKFPEKIREVGISVQELQLEATASFVAALKEDVERTQIFITPGLWSYYR